MMHAAREEDATVYCIETNQPCAPVKSLDACRCKSCMSAHPAACGCGICATVPRFWAKVLEISTANAL